MAGGSRSVHVDNNGRLQVRTGSVNSPVSGISLPSYDEMEYGDELGHYSRAEMVNRPAYDLSNGISSPLLTLVDVLEKEYETKRDAVIDEKNALRTPLKVVKDLSYDYSVNLEMQSFEVHNPAADAGPERIIHRIKLNAGQFSGDGQAPRHRLALQLAAADLLEKMKRGNAEFFVSPYGMLPGCRTNPFVYKDLKAFCIMKKLPAPVYKQIDPEGVNFYAYKCFVGVDFTVGESDSIYLSKRLSARRMYEKLTREGYPDDPTAVGPGCLQLGDFRAMGINPAQWKSVNLPVKSYSQYPRAVMDLDDDECMDEFAEDDDMIPIPLV